MHPRKVHVMPSGLRRKDVDVPGKFGPINEPPPITRFPLSSFACPLQKMLFADVLMQAIGNEEGGKDGPAETS
jgi:hypothetical protein